MWPAPVTLKGQHATLAPLSQDHAADLASSVGDLHKLWYTAIPSPEGMGAEIDRRLGLVGKGTMLPFAVLDPSGRAVGMTTYMNIDAANKRVEIGSTWMSASVQRSHMNTECKLMLLTHAFDNLCCIAVEWRTHYLNVQSRRAIERLGAKLDGILRAHMVMPNGSLRDTAVYSVTAAEWPAVETHLLWQMEKPRD